jgi:hypothetical protein
MAAARWTFFGLAGLGAIGLALAAPSPAPAPSPASTTAPFSRARWIAAAQRQAHFDGGLEQSDARTARRLRALRAAALAVAPKQHPRPTPGGPPNVRISEDILAPDPTSSAQPETEAEASLAADLSNEKHLVAGYQEDRFEDGGARALTFAASFDLGASWQEGLLPELTLAAGGPWERASDPWVAFGADGRVYYATIGFDETRPDNGVFVSTSDDGGRSFGAPSTVHLLTSRDFDDKEAVTVDNAADSPFANRVYVAWDTVAADQTHQTLRIAHSDDGGATWSAPVDVWSTGANVGALPLVGPGGVVHLLWMSYFSDHVDLLAAHSDDGGGTWSAPALVERPNTHGVADLRTGELVAAAIDPRRGALYAVWPDQRFTPGTDQIVLSTSWDGVGWSAPVRVSDGPNDAPSFTPAVAVNGQGHFGIAYSTLRNDPARRFLVDQYLVTINSRGRLLGATRSSTHSFDARAAAMSRGYFLGDYQGLVAGPRAFRPVWVATSDPSRLHGGTQPDAVTLVIR